MSRRERASYLLVFNAQPTGTVISRQWEKGRGEERKREKESERANKRETETDRQTNRDRETDRERRGEREGGESERERERERDRQTDRQTDRDRDRDRQTDRQKKRQANRRGLQISTCHEPYTRAKRKFINGTRASRQPGHVQWAWPCPIVSGTIRAVPCSLFLTNENRNVEFAGSRNSFL